MGFGPDLPAILKYFPKSCTIFFLIIFPTFSFLPTFSTIASPEHAISAGRQRFGPLLEQELPEAEHIALHIVVPVDVAHVKDEDLAILGTQRVQQGVDIVVLEAPLACGEVL